MRNKELIQLLGLEKSLVYFSTSLKSDEVTLEKILRGRIIKLYEEDEDLLEDVLIEVKQAIEMCNIYSGILSGTMDAFASVISNNLNIVMKILTAITIVMAIPNMVFSFYGMKVTAVSGLVGSGCHINRDCGSWRLYSCEKGYVPLIISFVHAGGHKKNGPFKVRSFCVLLLIKNGYAG